jgi:hypothetical protein
MLHYNDLVFDDVVLPDTVSFTDARWDAPLGRCDQFAMMAVVSEISGAGTGTFDAWIDETLDTVTWQTRILCSGGTSHFAGTGDVTIGSISAGNTYVKMYADACRGTSRYGSVVAGPLGPRVRLALLVGTLGARVRIHAVGRGDLR